MRRMCVLAAVMAMAAGCGFNPAGPFEGFDGAGSRITGSFASDLESQGDSRRLAAQSGGRSVASSDFAGIEVLVAERSTLRAAVGADGRFSIAGVPTGAWTLTFARDGGVIGQMRF